MYQSERMEEILAILKENHYVTVDYLVKKIRYSPASIRRDLTLLEQQGLVKRSWGGVEIKNESVTPFVFRQHSMKSAKNRIAASGANFVKNGDVVFIDGSSSSQYLGHFLTSKKDITVITNNMLLASYLREHGIETYCTGGFVSELPGILSGDLTANTYAAFHADVAFFSAVGFDGGRIYGNNDNYVRHIMVMLENSDRHIFLCGSDKIGQRGKMNICDLDRIDCFISDKSLDESVISKYKNTEFITV